MARRVELQLAWDALTRVLGLLSLVCVVTMLGSSCDDGQQSVKIVGRWTPEGSAVPAGLAPSDAMIEFKSDGTWQASDGCNRLEGAYAISGSNFEIGPGKPTAGVGCPHGEVEYGELLAASDRISESDDALAFKNADGEVILRLNRVD